ncbi:MAG TPA: hypothetical protein PKM59_16910 [Thermodesulfobacteriota bacterium]|nr:hypothetical protein [Thermodesulfobacteriota bacterium]
MQAREYILAKQVQWAMNRGLKLIGSKGERGRPLYTDKLDDNLFQPLDNEVRLSFSRGDGNEIKGSLDSPAKMQALHSSSALSVNVFQYWKQIDQVPAIEAACGFCRRDNKSPERIVFEDKYVIDNSLSGNPPNIDVVIHNAESAVTKRYAIECKFTEAYSSRSHGGLKQEYLKLADIWRDIPNIHTLAKSISPEDNSFHHLHPAQLIKHILGLKSALGKTGFRLLYLWYDAFGIAGARHRKEIDVFTKIAESDNIKFHALSYQELIIILSHEFRTGHPEYIKYLCERYL